MCQKNVGKVDAAIRAIIGIVILGAGYYYATWWGLLGLVPLLTALTGRCPLYYPLGISTCPAPQASASVTVETTETPVMPTPASPEVPATPPAPSEPANQQ